MCIFNLFPCYFWNKVFFFLESSICQKWKTEVNSILYNFFRGSFFQFWIGTGTFPPIRLSRQQLLHHGRQACITYVEGNSNNTWHFFGTFRTLFLPPPHVTFPFSIYAFRSNLSKCHTDYFSFWKTTLKVYKREFCVTARIGF